MRTDWLTAEAYGNWEERLGRHLTLWDLSVLKACVDLGSISKATEAVRLSKPAISKIIKDLEQEVGAPLVQRSRRGLQPTPAGRTLLCRGETALYELQTAVDSIRQLSKPTSGELRIAANEVALSRLVGEAINRFHSQYPGVFFDVVSAYTRTAQMNELEQGNVELVVGQVAHCDQHIEAQQLFQDRAVVVAGPKSPWANRPKIELAQMLDEPWAFFPLNSVSGRTMARAFRSSGLDLPKILVVGTSLQLLWRLVMDNEFLAVFPSSVAGASRSLVTLPVSVSALWHPIGVLTIKHRALSPLANHFIDCARSVVKQSDIYGSSGTET